MTRAIIISALLISTLLPGCAMSGKGVTVSDSFCLSPSSKKRKWSIKDRPAAIREARVWNKYVDDRCGVPGKGAAA
jgi:predicted small secreted protein